jgi:hypothetical protein
MKTLFLTGSLSLFIFFGCSEEDNLTQTPPTTSQFTINITGLEELGNNAAITIGQGAAR